MKRTRSYKDRKPEPGPQRKSLSVEENITPMQMETETPTTGHGTTEDLPNALGQMIATIIKEISKETGGLANLSRSLVGNSTSNVQMRQPHVNMDLQENESQLRQDPEFKQPELNAALAVIKKTMELDAADPFNRPVDPIELELPDYFDVIKTPMDFGTIRNNLENGLKYMNSADVYKDVQYIWNNCIKYNKKGDHILELMKRVKTFFMKCWKAAGLHTERLQTNVDALRGTESSIAGHNKRQKENSSAPFAYKFPQSQQKEACSNQVAENLPVPINMYGQPQQSSSQPQSSAEQYEANICTPDSTVTQKKRGIQQPRHCHKLLTTAGRIKIVTNELGQPVGREAAKLTSFLGLTARDGNLAPLNYPGWSKMPEENKENMWQKVLTKFDIDPSCRSWVLRSLESKWRNFKSHLKATHYDAHATDVERLADRDKRVLPDQWSVLVSQWSSDKFQRISAKNKANRAKVKFIHASGTKSFARLLEEERAKRPDGQEPSQAELFILTRTRKNGQPVNENTAAVISQLRESATEDDAYNRVMGEDREGGVFLSGLKATPGTKNPTRAEALKMVKEKNAEVVEMKERLASVEQTCSQMTAQMSTMMSMMSNMQKFFPAENISSDAAVGTLAPVDMPNQSEPPSTSNRVVPAKKTRGRKKRR